MSAVAMDQKCHRVCAAERMATVGQTQTEMAGRSGHVPQQLASDCSRSEGMADMDVFTQQGDINPD